jgi:hypothetical protein
VLVASTGTMMPAKTNRCWFYQYLGAVNAFCRRSTLLRRVLVIMVLPFGGLASLYSLTQQPAP